MSALNPSPFQRHIYRSLVRQCNQIILQLVKNSKMSLQDFGILLGHEFLMLLMLNIHPVANRCKCRLMYERCNEPRLRGAHVRVGNFINYVKVKALEISSGRARERRADSNKLPTFIKRGSNARRRRRQLGHEFEAQAKRNFHAPRKFGVWTTFFGTPWKNGDYQYLCRQFWLRRRVKRTVIRCQHCKLYTKSWNINNKLCNYPSNQILIKINLMLKKFK